MKRFILSLMLVCAIFVAQSQYYYPYDSSNYYYDDSPSLIIQKDKIMGWYVSDIDGKGFVGRYFLLVGEHVYARGEVVFELLLGPAADVCEAIVERYVEKIVEVAEY